MNARGSTYVHAGTHGLYYRQTIGGSRRQTPSSPVSPTPAYDTRDVEDGASLPGADRYYTTAGAEQLGSASNDEILHLLRASARLPRTDVIAACVVLPIMLATACLDYRFALATLIIGFPYVVMLSYWETSRRALSINFNLSDEAAVGYEAMIRALDVLGDCAMAWRLTSSTDIVGHRSKLNAGADELVTRHAVTIGTSPQMPWAKCNFSIPTIGIANQAYYFLPNGVYVFAKHTIGFVPYSDLALVRTDNHRYIEGERVPRDATVIDYTWQHPNKDGGPDKRFANNQQIPVCAYGQIELKSSGGLHWMLQTSNRDAPDEFANRFAYGVQVLPAAATTIEPLGTERYCQSFSQMHSRLLGDAIAWMSAAPRRYDDSLKRFIGEENEIILWFLRLFVPILALTGSIGAGYAIMSLI